MPTPMPIMAAISGEKLGTTRTWVNSSSSAMPIPSPHRAVITGRPMATTEPKANSMMIMAAVMPIPSLGPGAALTAAEMGEPPRATAKPGRAADCAVAISFLRSLVERSAVSFENCTWAKAMVRSGAIWCAPAAEKGPVTERTSGNDETLATTWSMAERWSGMGVAV